MNSTNRKKDKPGFTLAEVLIATSIAGIAATAIIAFLIFGLRSNASATNSLANSYAIRETTQQLMRDIRSADNTKVLLSQSSLTEVDIESEGDVLVLFYNAWNITASSDKVERYIVYFLDANKNLYRIADDSISLDDADEFKFASIDFASKDRRLVATNTDKYSNLAIFERLPNRIRVRASFSSEGSLGTSKVTLYNFVATPRG